MVYRVVTQNCTGDVDIIPRCRRWEPRKLLSIPGEEETCDLIRAGERATWPKHEMIRNCTLVGRTLDRPGTALEHECALRAAHFRDSRQYVAEDWAPH